MAADPNESATDKDASSTTPPKARNPVERVVVWGLILGLVAIVGVEAFARVGYSNSLNSLQAAMEADSDGDTLMVEEIPAHISGAPSRQVDEEQRIITYHWSGLLKDYGNIQLSYSQENEVLGLKTADAPPPTETVPDLANGPDGAREASSGGTRGESDDSRPQRPQRPE